MDRLIYIEDDILSACYMESVYCLDDVEIEVYCLDDIWSQ